MNLYISGQVNAFATVQPRQIRLSGRIGQPLTSQALITPEKAYPFKIISHRAQRGQHIRYTLQEQQNSDRTRYLLEVENIKTKPGRYVDTIVLDTDSDIRPKLTVKVYGYLKQPAAVLPKKTN